MQNIGDEWGCYGNAFVRLYVPFERILLDPRPEFKGKFYTFANFNGYLDQIKFNSKDLTFTVPDIQNNFNGSITCQFIDKIDKRKEIFD